MPVSERDILRLKGVHPKLVEIIVLALNQLPMFVVCGVRTTEEQAKLYARGRTAPGPIVTNADGVHSRSRHQTHEDGLGWAVDCAFLGNEPYSPSHDWKAYGRLLEAQGAIWGGRWKHPVDCPHAELPNSGTILAGVPLPFPETS